MNTIPFNENVTRDQPGRVMVVDDHRQARESMADALRSAGHEVVCCSSAPEALQVLERGDFDCVLTDLKMPGMNGVEFIIQLEQRRLGAAAVMVTAYATVATAVEAMRHGAFDYIEKPFSADQLERLVGQAIRHSRLVRQDIRGASRGSQCEEPEMIGSSPQMRMLRDRIAQVAPAPETVLITGESGTGKELIARAIHNLGSRSNRPFVAVSCGAIPETLIEAELFGHEKGAFTGTVGSREGYFEQAGDGTLFLDEIGDLSLFTQVKLLRVLQQMEFSRLGSNKLIPLRARLIFATHRDLDRLVAEGKFRQDLFYRINVMRIDSPALQEHPEDVPRIARHFLRHYGQVFQKPMVDIEPDAMAMLQNYSWPGNVRELENVMQRAIILAAGQTVRAEDLSLNSPEPEDDGGDIDDVVDIGDFHPAGSFERQLRDYKIKLAVASVRENNGNKTLAARKLCISRAYLHRLIRLAEPDPIFEQDLREFSA